MPPKKEFSIEGVTAARDRKVTDQAGTQYRGPRLLRTKDAARYLGISPWKLRKLVQDGLLPFVQEAEGAAWRLDLSDLDCFVVRNKKVSR